MSVNRDFQQLQIRKGIAFHIRRCSELHHDLKSLKSSCLRLIWLAIDRRLNTHAVAIFIANGVEIFSSHGHQFEST